MQEEWTRNLLEHRPNISPAQLAHPCEQMNRAIPDALVPTVTTEDGYDLPDPDDRHVLAAALTCEAEVLLTFNLKDFPAAAVPADLKVVHPDLYLVDYFKAHPQAIVTALQNLRANLKRPPLTQEEILAGLQKAGLLRFVRAVQESGLQF